MIRNDNIEAVRAVIEDGEPVATLESDYREAKKEVKLPVDIKLVNLNPTSHKRVLPTFYEEAATTDGPIRRIGRSMTNPFAFYLFEHTPTETDPDAMTYVATVNLTPAFSFITNHWPELKTGVLASGNQEIEVAGKDTNDRS